MASPGRRHRRRHRPHDDCPACSGRLDPDLAATRDGATSALQAQLARLDDPIGEALESLSGEEFISLVWQVPKAQRTEFLIDLGVPPARRPTAIAARMGMGKLRHWPTDKRDRAARFLTATVVARLDVIWHGTSTEQDQQDRDDAMHAAISASASHTNAMRLALVCQGHRSHAMTVALRVGLTHGLALANWPQDVLDNVIEACHLLEDAWAQTDEALDHDDDGATADEQQHDDQLADASEAAADSAAHTSPTLTVTAGDAPHPGRDLMTEGPHIVPGVSTPPDLDGKTITDPADADPPPSSQDLTAAATALRTHHDAAQQAAAVLADLLRLGTVPQRATLEPVLTFIDAVDHIHELLARAGQSTTADATVDDLVTALTGTAEHHDQRARLADLTRLAGPANEEQRVTAAVTLATALTTATVWNTQQQQHATGLLALRDLIDAVAAKNSQALPTALAGTEQYLPQHLAALRFAALVGDLQIVSNSDPAAGPPEDSVPVQPTPQPAQGSDNATEAVASQTYPPLPVDAPMSVSDLDDSAPNSANTGVATDPATDPVTAVSGDDDIAANDGALNADDRAADRDLVRQLLGEGRLSLAFHAAAACADRRRADSLRVLTLAEAVRSETGPTAGALRTALETEQASTPGTDLAAQLLLLAGAIRACLVTADAGSGQSVLAIVSALPQLPALAAACETIGTASAHGRLYSPDVLAALAPIAGADNDIAVTVEAVQADLGRRRTSEFVRASQIAELWWAPDGLLGRLLATAAADRRSEIETVATQLRLFAKRQYLEDILTREDNKLRASSSQQLQGQPRRKLKEAAERSVAAVRAWVDAVRANQTAEHGPVPAHLATLRRTVKAQWPAAEQELRELITADTAVPVMLQAAAAQACLVSMQRSVDMLDGDKPAGPDRNPDAVLYQDLLRSADLPFAVEGVPARPVTVDDVRAAAVTSWDEAFERRLADEQYTIAALVIDAVADPRTARAMHDRLAEAAARSHAELLALHRATAGEVARAARLGQLDETASSAINSMLEAGDVNQLTDSAQRANLGELRARLLDVKSRLPQHLHDAQEALRKRADNEVPQNRNRQELLDAIYARIDNGDLATAEEYLLAAVDGGAPPTEKVSADLDQFLTLIGQVPGGLTRDLITAIRDGKPPAVLGLAELSTIQRATADTLQTWLDMRDIRQSTVQKSTLMAALRLAGIEFANMQPLRELSGGSRRAWWDLTEVRRIGDTLGMPQFSPSAGDRQRIMLCWGDPDVQAMFGWIAQDPGSNHPVIVLLFAPMTAEQRTELALMCAQRGEKPVIVIDDIALLHLAMHGRGQFLTTARILLPFTATNPYAPEGLAALPSEMFFGRRSERNKIIDPNGPNLLYGGRQLGKTALLQEAARTFERVGDHRAVYVTLHNAIGTQVNPLTLWDKLSEKLTQLKILPPRKTRDVIKNVTTAITAWLDANPVRRMLLLIDECDGFFDADASMGFQHVTHLRELRDSRGRRCKPVFAGLHQVQRFAHLPNQPLAGAHLGEQIAIGPLSPLPAYQLLFTPMEALGIRFAADELIHRILAYCNYQPKLLQLVGEALVGSSVARRRTGPSYVIDENDLDKVIASGTLQQRVRQTVHLTLDLDSRYKLIALVVAYAALENGVDHTMSTAELTEECQKWWAAGFAGQGAGEFRSLLEEMRDLGVLAVTEGVRWRLRSTNVLRLLGSAHEIWEELCSPQWRTTVTKLSAEQGRRRLDDGRISPCTEHQLSRLVSRTGGNTVRVIAATPATGFSAVETLLGQAQKGFGARFELKVPNSPQAYGKALRSGEPGGLHRVVLSPLRAKADTITDTIVKAMQLQPASGATRTVAVLVDTTHPGTLDALTTPGFAVRDDDVIALRRVSGAGLRSWLSGNDAMTAFADAASQANLLATTGGWWLLLDRAVQKARESSSVRKVCEYISTSLNTVDGADEFLDATGLRVDSRTEAAFHYLLHWAEPVTTEELIQLCAEAGPAPQRTARILYLLDVLDQSDVNGLWSPEPVIARAWRQLHATA